MFINFSDLPGHNNLFLDYLYEFDNVKEYYYHDFRNIEGYNKVFKSISESVRTDRSLLVNILGNQYKGYNLSEKTSKNISSLMSKKTIAVVTGQQLGIFGGPLYTAYKIITSIKLAAKLNKEYENYNFVPVFWLEGDDHDFEEVGSLFLLNGNNDMQEIKYSDGVIDEEENKGSVGNILLNGNITNVLNEIEIALRDTEFKAPLMEKMRQIYSEGKKFKEAFKEFIFWLFDKYGLIIFDPQDSIIKSILRPVYLKEINNFRVHSEKLVEVSAKLDEQYHTQVKVKPVNLFYSYEGGRYLIEPGENEFKLKRKRRKFQPEELLETIEREPENFSANVLLRPISQDYILPTAFYVGGPGEIAYFAQVNPLYRFYGIEPPVLYPRSSATIMEKSISNLLTKYNLNFNEIFNSSEKVKEKVLKSLTENDLENLFNSVNTDIELTFDKIKEQLFEVDKTISDSSLKYKQKILGYIGELKTKSVEAQKRKFETTMRQVEKLTAYIYPNGVLQERELNILYFLNKYGEDFIKKLFDEFELDKFEHQVISI